MLRYLEEHIKHQGLADMIVSANIITTVRQFHHLNFVVCIISIISSYNHLALGSTYFYRAKTISYESSCVRDFLSAESVIDSIAMVIFITCLLTLCMCCGSHSVEQSSCCIQRPDSQRCLLPTAFKDSSVCTTASAPQCLACARFVYDYALYKFGLLSICLSRAAVVSK